MVEDHIFGTKLSGLPMQTTWDMTDWDADYEWPFTTAADDAPAELYAMWDAAADRSRTRLGEAVDGRIGEDPLPGWRLRS